MRSVRLRRTAREEIEDAFEWDRRQSPTGALRFLVAVDEALAAIRDRPETFPMVTGALRRTLLRRFPYAVYFKDLRANESGVVRSCAPAFGTREIGFAGEALTRRWWLAGPTSEAPLLGGLGGAFLMMPPAEERPIG